MFSVLDRFQYGHPLRVAALTLAFPLAFALAFACATHDAGAQTITVRDDIGRTITVPRAPRRIISLIPSATETLIALGLGDRIVGRTNYDKEPVLARVPSVGGGLEPNLEILLALKPDLVITWTAEKRQALQTQLAAAGITIFHLATQDTTDIFRGITNIGRLTGRDSAARALDASMHAEFRRIKTETGAKKRPTVLYVVSSDPALTVGPKTYISQVVGIAGGTTIFPDLTQNWPRVSIEEIARRKPDYLVLPVGEFRANALDHLKNAPGWRDLGAVRAGRIIVISSDLGNHPGPNITILARQIHDGLFPHSRR